jgi:hypothetical protein
MCASSGTVLLAVALAGLQQTAPRAQAARAAQGGEQDRPATDLTEMERACVERVLAPAAGENLPHDQQVNRLCAELTATSAKNSKYHLACQITICSDTYGDKTKLGFVVEDRQSFKGSNGRNTTSLAARLSSGGGPPHVVYMATVQRTDLQTRKIEDYNIRKDYQCSSGQFREYLAHREVFR